PGGEQHRVIVRNPHQRAQVAFRRLGDFQELGTAMAEFDDRSARAAKIEHLALRLLQDGFRERGGPGTEVEGTRHWISLAGFAHTSMAQCSSDVATLAPCLWSNGNPLAETDDHGPA